MILISPYSKPLKNGNPNPKNYPYWKELISLLPNKPPNNIMQAMYKGEEFIKDCGIGFIEYTSLREFSQWIEFNTCIIIVSVDNFLPHLAHYYGKQSIVLWGQSDPNLFGYKENINLLKSRIFLRPNQFDTWDGILYKKESFVSPEIVVEQINKLL